MGKIRIEIAKSDRLMTIFTAGTSTQLVGLKADLVKFKKQIKDKENRHTFLEVPTHLFKQTAPYEEVTIKPADVNLIIIADPSKAPPAGPGILAPAPFSGGPIGRG
jgi:hypothetical protein